MRQYVIAVDIAKKEDRTVIGIGRKSIQRRPDGMMVSYLDLMDMDMVSRMSYPAQARYIARLDGDSVLSGDYDLIVDGTGVGEAVFDMLRDEGLNPMKIIFTSGDRASAIQARSPSGFTRREGWNVPKNAMVDTLALALQQRRLRILPGVPFREDIETQMAAFTGRLTKGRNMVYNNETDSIHDDIVSMLMMMAWHFMQAEGARADFRLDQSEFGSGLPRRKDMRASADYNPLGEV